MIQDDRTVQAFVLKDGGQSELGSRICAMLNRNLVDIRSWLGIKRSNGSFSHGFLVELSMKSTIGQIHIHAIYDEIGKLEGTDSTPSMTKKPRKMGQPLHGLWHKHYFHPSFMARNLADEAERMSKDGRWEAMFAPHYGKYIHGIIDQISREMVMGAYERRANDKRITSDFIVYGRLADGSNYYLTLGQHGEWDGIRARVEEYKKFDIGSDPPWMDRER